MNATLIPEECVRNGEAVLDEHVPGWFERIDAETLSVANPKSCPLGQLFDTFAEGIDALGLAQADSQRLGFNFDYRRGLDPRELNAEWRERISARLGEAGAGSRREAKGVKRSYGLDHADNRRADRTGVA